MTADHHTHWETRYAEKPRIWSGRPNAHLAELVGPLTGSRALDLGCGEGGDAMWLAEHGWHVVAVDVSTTALTRAAEDAAARGVLERIDFQQHDLTKTLPEGPFDLVSAHFFHTTLEMDRPAILRRAAATIAPGGTLLIVDHGGAPAWAPEEVHHHEFPAPEEVLAGLALDDTQWETVKLGAIKRDAVGPEGQQAVLVDNIIQVRRR